jgi:hypothetical protein
LTLPECSVAEPDGECEPEHSKPARSVRADMIGPIHLINLDSSVARLKRFLYVQSRSRACASSPRHGWKRSRQTETHRRWDYSRRLVIFTRLVGMCSVTYPLVATSGIPKPKYYHFRGRCHQCA